jgi:hypothetical protein
VSDAIDDRGEAVLCDSEDAEASDDDSRLEGSIDEDEDPGTDADGSEDELSREVNDEVDAEVDAEVDVSDEELDVVELNPKLDATETNTGTDALDGEAE